MKTALHLFYITSVVLAILACKEEFHPLNTQSVSPADCQAPSFGKNIIGTWHFESTYAPFPSTDSALVTQGTVTFTADKTIIDPDSLFRIAHTVASVLAETYEPDTTLITPGGNFGKVFAVYLHCRNVTQVDAFLVVTNTCNQIEIRPPNSASSDKHAIFLTRYR